MTAPFTITFLVPSAKRPIGGVMALFEFANALCRRGHAVHLVHVPTIKGHIEDLGDLSWFHFEGGLTHHVLPEFDPGALPRSDFIELTALRFFTDSDFMGAVGPHADSSFGLPLLFFQAYGIFPEPVDERVLAAPCPKVCIARWLVDVARSKGVPENEVEHIPYGLKHDKYRLATPIDARPMQVSMLYSVHQLKGAEDGLEALARVRHRVPGARIVIFGNRDPVHEIPDDMVFLKNPEQGVIVDEVYNRSRVFLSPSVMEGFGFCPVEAMACGSALVTTANGGSDDYAIDGENALVCAPRDVAAMAAHVETLLLDDEHRLTLATRGVESVKRFDWDESGRQLEEFLRRYAENPAAFGATRSHSAVAP